MRDTAGIRGVGIPVFCRGVSPNSPARNGPGTVGEPLALGGVAVAAGDVAVLDEDGVVIVPRDRLDAVLARLPAIREAEAELDAKVKSGLGVPGFVCTVLEGPRDPPPR